VVSLDQVAALASALPEVTEEVRRGQRTWLVAGKSFAWERPLTQADVKRFGAERVPEGDIVAVHVGDLGEKEAILAEGHPGFFSMQHFDGYPAVLVELGRARRTALRELLTDGWLAAAPVELAELAGQGALGRP
jgi:hypothetical protein